jgi:Tol biopolymer transport system component
VIAPVAGAATAKAKRVSVKTSGAEANGLSFMPSISANGRYVAFSSRATNLSSSDTNAQDDIYVHDRKMKRTKLVSKSSSGVVRGDNSRCPVISANGRFIAFQSEAEDLVGGDTNGMFDVFVHDRKTRKTKRVSIASDGSEEDGPSRDPSISADGRFVAFESFAGNFSANHGDKHLDVFVHYRVTRKTKRVSLKRGGGSPGGNSSNPSISADGRFVAFVSGADNLIGSDDNNEYDVFVRGRQKKRTRRVNVKTGGGHTNEGSGDASISASGRFIAFVSDADNLISNDDNGVQDVFVHDRKTKKTRRASVRRLGGEANGASGRPSVSGDGRFVAFESDADDIVTDGNTEEDVFVRGPLR